MDIIQEDELKGTICEFMENYDLNSLEGQKYDFHLSGWILKAAFKAPIDIRELPIDKKSSAVIEPGETVFVMTQEYLTLPLNTSVTLVPKRKIGHDGIIVLGGMRVDPGYHGQLFIGLYNFASQDFVLSPGRKLIAGIFSKHEKEVSFRPKNMQKNCFPEDLQKMINKYSPVNSAGIAKRLEDVEQHLKKVEEILSDDRDWRKEIRETIAELNKALKEETLARKEHIAELHAQMEKEQIGLKNRLDSQDSIYKSKSETNSRWLAAVGVTMGVVGAVAAILALVFR